LCFFASRQILPEFIRLFVTVQVVKRSWASLDDVLIRVVFASPLISLLLNASAPPVHQCAHNTKDGSDQHILKIRHHVTIWLGIDRVRPGQVIHGYSRHRNSVQHYEVLISDLKLQLCRVSAVHIHSEDATVLGVE
jgi:hypothetical protein